MHRVRYILRSTYGGEGFWNWVFRASNCVDSGYARVQDLLPPVDPTDSIGVNVRITKFLSSPFTIRVPFFPNISDLIRGP